MDKDLLDISGEDEEDNWLLKNTPKKVISGREKSYLNCSPLQIPRSSRIVPTRPPFSPIGRVTGTSNNMEQPCASVDTDSVGKENSKVELPKLSVERQQMKKKKKNAGFNLRKSLAWDRAFSTEEGVLDSSELSKITGTACQFGGDRLPAIQEEFRESMSASKCTSVSPGLQALEENLFNDLPVNSKNREKKLLSGIMPKELSISKVPTTKSEPLTVANNMKRTAQSPSKAKKSQPTQLKNSQKSLGSESFSKNTSSTKSKTKSSLASKSSIPKPSLKQARRNVISKTSEIPSVSNSHHSVVAKSNVGPMTASDVAMFGLASDIPESNVITLGTSLTQSSCNRLGNKQSAVSRLGKPSGLRVPKPSIGYFSQSDSQPSHSAGDKHSQLPRSDVSSASHISLIPTFTKPQIAEKLPGVKSKAATGILGSSGSAARFSAQSICLKPSQEKVKVDLKSTQEVESNSLCCSLSSQINENLQHQFAIQGDTGKLVLDDVTYCTSEKNSTAKCQEFQSNSELPPSACKNNVQDGSNMSDHNKDEKRKSCRSVEEYCALPLKDSMDSPMQSPPSDELTLFDNDSQLKVSNQGEEDMCTTNDFSGDFDTLDVHGQPLNECVHPGNEDEISPCLSGENDALIVYHSTENVAKQPEVLDSVTADPTFFEDFASIKGEVDDLSSSENRLGNTEYVSVPLGPSEAPDCVQSPCNHLEENAVANSILCDHNMVCDGQAVLETEKRLEISESTETNCEADFIGPISECKDWFRESEEQYLSSQLVLEVKEGGHEIDVLIRNEGADGPGMQIECFTGSSDADNMKQVKLLRPSSVEVRMEIKPLELSHEPFSEKSTPEKQKQHNCSSSENAPDVNDGCVMKQADQLGTLVGCSPEKDASSAVFSYSNEELEDYSELEDMDLGTDSDCSDVEAEDNLERTEVHGVTDPVLISDLDEFSVKGILNQEYPQEEDIHTASDLCGKTKNLLRESISSSDSIFGDPECLNEGTNFSRISEAEYLIEAEKDFSAQVTGQELVPDEGEEVKVVKISPDPVVFALREEESGTPIPTKETFSVRDDMQINEFNVLSDDILTSETNASEGKEKMILLDTKLEKKPDPITVKPPNAVPFSDEWLAAIEAAGEEILTLKSGRVQHSPTEKSAPEPGPWSPVKKKSNQVVGPFDCTKYNNKGLPPAFD
ncbi:unnamed protein product [Arabidopsis halleri]